MLCVGDFLAGDSVVVVVNYITDTGAEDEDAFSIVLVGNATATEVAQALAQDINALPRYESWAINENVFVQPSQVNRVVDILNATVTS
jgi:hypothetical protein